MRKGHVPASRARRLLGKLVRGGCDVDGGFTQPTARHKWKLKLGTSQRGEEGNGRRQNGHFASCLPCGKGAPNEIGSIDGEKSAWRGRSQRSTRSGWMRS